MPTDLTVILPHQPGELARLGRSYGEAGVSIRGLAAFTGAGRGVAHVLLDTFGGVKIVIATDDLESARCDRGEHCGSRR